MSLDLWPEYEAALALGRHGCLGFAKITPDCDGYYEPEGQLLTFISPALDRDDDLAELIAIDIGPPLRWWRRTGDLPILGINVLRKAALFGEPVTVCEDPLAWLRARGKAACILDWSAPLWREFEGVGEIQPPTLPLAQRIEKAIQPPKPRLPTITIPRAAA